MSATRPILTVLEVSVDDPLGGEPWALGSFELPPGQWARVDAGSPSRLDVLGDVFSGLLGPRAGRVVFQGTDWAAAGPHAAVQLRAHIGRVFYSAAWLANLDVDENVLLAALYHTPRPEAEWQAEALAWARRFGMHALPTTRPAVTPVADLQRAQWVRALLMRPALLVLEEPDRDVPPSSAAAFWSAVAELLSAGSALVWITLDSARPNPAPLPACAVRRSWPTFQAPPKDAQEARQ